MNSAGETKMFVVYIRECAEDWGRPWRFLENAITRDEAVAIADHFFLASKKPVDVAVNDGGCGWTHVRRGSPRAG